MHFSYRSKDSLNYVSLHDCFINYAEWVNNSLILYLDWIDVLKTHPFNPTGKDKITRGAALIFEDALELSCFYYDLSEARIKGGKIKKQVFYIPDDAEIINSSIIELCKHAEISDDDEILENDKKIWTCSCNVFDDAEFKISYSTMWVCFNELEEDSWLEYQPK